jgi:hypothetical protein
MFRERKPFMSEEPKTPDFAPPLRNPTLVEPRFADAAGTASGTGFAYGIGAWIAPLPEDHAFYKNVGRIASEWSHLEHILDMAIWKLSGMPDNIAACITSQIMNVMGRCHAIVNLARLRGLPKDKFRPYNSLKGDSYAVSELRNRAVHDAWYAQMPSGTPMQFKAMPFSEPYHGFREITQEETEETIQKIRCLQERARQYYNDISDALATSQESIS